MTKLTANTFKTIAMAFATALMDILGQHSGMRYAGCR